VNFGASSEAYLAVLFGSGEPKGALPFDIPSSMAAVEASRPDVPFDTANPTFHFGNGLRFEDWAPAVRPAEDSTTIQVVAPTSRYDLAKTPLKVVLADLEARAILDELVPELSHHPMIALAKGMPVDTVLGMAAQDASAGVIDQLRARLIELAPN
jgi:beta-glucosidase